MRYHSPLLDGMRAISITLVMSAHMLPLGPTPWLVNATVGAMGMSLFFCLSGFLITRQLLQDDDVKKFLVRRFARILPLAWLYTAVTFFVIQSDPATALRTASFFLNYTPMFIDSDNGHLWSLCIEMQFYVAIALTVYLFGRRALWLVVPACLAVTSYRIGSGAYTDIQTHLRVDEILVGASLAALVSARTRAIGSTSPAFLSSALLIWVLSASPLTGWEQYLRPYATALVFYAVLNLPENALHRALSARVLGYVASISYALYVIHPITMHGWLAGSSTLDRYVIKRPISVFLSFVLAHLSTKYWETPWQQLVRGEGVLEEFRRGIVDRWAPAGPVHDRAAPAPQLLKLEHTG